MNEIICPFLAREPEFATHFPAPSLAFGQAWQAHLQSDFRPAEVRLGWREDALWMWAKMDGKGRSRATQNNEPMWLRGDVVELFLAREGEESYHELHATPNGLTLQLGFPNSAAIEATGENPEQSLARFVVEKGWRAQVESDEYGWSVLARLPLELKAGDRFKFACGRYDCSSGKDVLSSTAPLLQLDFHRRADWQTLVLTDAV